MVNGSHSGVRPGAKRTRNDRINLILRGENPVAAGMQADDVTGSEVAVPRRVDLDHGIAVAGRVSVTIGALCRTECADMGDRTFQQPAADRPDLRVVASDEQL